jgi:hypothetical protein
VQSSVDIAALNGDHSLVAAATRVPSRQHMPCRMFEQHSHVMFRRGQIADRQYHRACHRAEGDTQRDCVIAGQSVGDAAFDGSHCLIRPSTQPQDPGEVDLRRHPLRAALEAKELPLPRRGDVVVKHVLEMALRVEQIAEITLRCTDRSLADKAIDRVGRGRRQSMEPLCHGKGGTVVASVDVKGTHAPK